MLINPKHYNHHRNHDGRPNHSSLKGVIFLVLTFSTPVIQPTIQARTSSSSSTTPSSSSTLLSSSTIIFLPSSQEHHHHCPHLCQQVDLNTACILRFHAECRGRPQQLLKRVARLFAKPTQLFDILGVTIVSKP